MGMELEIDDLINSRANIDQLIKEGYKGYWLCPYCLHVYPDQGVCCSEAHMEEIK
jgi:hypothetical protein